MGAWALALHGGAGMIAQEKMSADWQKCTEEALNEILNIGITALQNKLTALETVELVVSVILQIPQQLGKELSLYATFFWRS